MCLYLYDGSLGGILSCVFHAFQFKAFDGHLSSKDQHQQMLFDDCFEVAVNEQHAERVWTALKNKIDPSTLKGLIYAYLSESLIAHQHIFNFCIYVFQNSKKVDHNYGHVDVLAISQWAKQVGREKHRMEAFVRFKKCQDGLFLALVRPDFNVLPLIERHFLSRYQDQSWLIYDEKRHYGIYYDLQSVHQVHMRAEQIDPNINIGTSQHFALSLDPDEVLYDQLWKDYFQSVNIKARENLRLHIQYVPKRYWRYLNEKIL